MTHFPKAITTLVKYTSGNDNLTDCVPGELYPLISIDAEYRPRNAIPVASSDILQHEAAEPIE